MDIVLGVSMTPTSVRMVLVEGENADGVTVDHDVFTIAEGQDAPAQVIAAILGTRESALESGHRLVSTGVTWSDHVSAAALRDAVKANNIDDVLLVSELHAAGALATAAGGAMEYQRTGLMFLERDIATLSVVDNSDGSIVKVQRRELHSEDAVAELGAMLAGLEDLPAPLDGVFVVGSGVNVAAIKLQLESATALPVIAPGEADLALARGAALAGTQAPLFEATTAGLAYALAAEEGATAGSPFAASLAAAVTQVAGAEYGGSSQLAYSAVDDDVDDEAFAAELAAAEAELTDADQPEGAERKPFLLVGSALTTVFVVGIAALAISLAVTIRPTAQQRPEQNDAVVVPAQQMQAAEPAAAVPAPPPAAPEVKPPAAPAPAAPAPVPAAPAPVVQPVQAKPPAPVRVEAPVPAAPAPAPVPVVVPEPPVVVPVVVPEAPIAPAPAPVPAVVPQAPVPAAVPVQPSPPIGFFPGQSPQLGTFNPGDDDERPRQQYPQYPQQQYPQYPQQQYPQQQYPRRGDYDFDRGSNGRSKRDHSPRLPFLPWPFGNR